jgi:large conductance mechanosensitive channel
MIQEFKDFIMKGNVLELAVAVIIAGAFGAVVTSFTNDVIMPPIGQALGGVDFAELKYALADDVVAEDGTVTAGAAIRYGNFIQMIINFLIIAFVLFMIVRTYNKVQAAEEEAPAPDPGPSDNDLLKEILVALKK